MYVRISWKQNNLKSFQVTKMLKFSLSAKHGCWNLLRKKFPVNAGPILEFKGGIQNVQKGHLSLVTQVDLILQNPWKFTWILVKQVIYLAHAFKVYGSFYSFLFPLEDFENTWQWEKENFTIFLLFLSRTNSQRCHHWIIKLTDRIFKNLLRSFSHHGWAAK